MVEVTDDHRLLVVEFLSNHVGTISIGNSSVNLAWLESTAGVISYSDPVVRTGILITVSKDSGDSRTEMLVTDSVESI